MREELENSSESEKKISLMLAGLKRVEAPKDFEFRLKARIAKANPRSYQTNYKKRFALYALPASAFAVISTFVVFNGGLFGGLPGPEDSVETKIQPAKTIQPENSAPPLYVENPVKGDETEPTVPVNPRIDPNRKSEHSLAVAPPSPDRKKREVRKDGGGSFEIGVSPPPDVKTPKGTNPDNKIEVPIDLSSEKGTSEQEAISFLGAETVVENGRLKVKSVKPNSEAERKGIKPDDVIETLDGRKVAGESSPGKKITIKKIGVKRGDKQVEIDLQAKPQ